MKRLFDVVASGIALVVFSPFGIVIGIILRLTGEGEVFYRQKRVGRNGREFGLLKFATMLKDSPNMGTRTITQREDPRVLPIGKLLRNTKINEVPQFWNVLVGDMSIVGPRPLTRETHEYIPESNLREVEHLQPGLTGIGSIIFRDEETLIHNSDKDPHDFYRLEIAPFKGELEMWYMRQRSFAFDMKIIAVTAWVVVFPASRVVNRFFPNLPKHALFNP